MLHNQYLKDWSKIVSNHFTHLSLPEVAGLATWSFGMVITGSSSLTRVSEFIAKINGVVPDDWQVIVSADRGLYADWIFEEICALNWHPFLRINHQGTYRIRGEEEWKCLDTVVPKTGMSWTGLVTCFKSNPLDCSLLARWDKGYLDPWLIVTDLEPQQGNALWYGFRSWIESSYRDLKSDGWQWHKTRLRETARAERIWLAMAVATLWTVTMGSDEHQHLQKTLKDKAISYNEVQPKSVLKNSSRNISCFLQGLINIVADLLCGKGIYLNDLFPQSSFAVNTS